MTGANVKSIFGSILELSGFPEGYAIPDGALRQCPPSRTNSQKEKLKKIKENEVTDSHKVRPSLAFYFFQINEFFEKVSFLINSLSQTISYFTF